MPKQAGELGCTLSSLPESQGCSPDQWRDNCLSREPGKRTV